MYLLSDNVDTETGLRLAGVEGEIIHTTQELHRALDKIFEQEDIAIVLLTTKVLNLDNKKILEYKLERSLPLFVEISDRHGSHEVQEMIDQTISKIIGKVN